MNDYKELIKELKRNGLSNGSRLGHHSGLCDDAADAIEQLVKERKELKEVSLLLKANCDHFKRERDAAIADLKSVLAGAEDINVCLYCKHREEDGQCHHECHFYTREWGWEWRGAREVEDGNS